MTWAEFKEWAESRGVTDEMIIDYIDFSASPSKILIEDAEISIW